MLRRRIAPTLIAAALVALVAAGPTNARPSGSGSLAATLSASPNPVPAWSQYTVKGCGFVTGKQVNMVINGGVFFATAVDASGCTSFSWWADAAGTAYDIRAYQLLKGQRQTLMARTSLTAV